MARVSLRAWQAEALSSWKDADHRGIVSVVTGAGKTILALACIDVLKPETSLVVVPTIALLDQWWSEAANFFDLDLDEINVLAGTQRRIRSGTINLAVLNTAAKLTASNRGATSFLIVDECHKAASEQFRAVLNVRTTASLGLSATPERPYDNWLREILEPALGSIIYTYTYREALRDGVIVPFTLHNVVFDLENDQQKEYDKLTKAIARSIDTNGLEANETISLLLRRTRVLNLSLNRVRLTLRLVAANKEKKILIFHEDIRAVDLIYQVLSENHVKAGIYHSKIPLKERVKMLSAYRHGDIQVLVTCRALDEGFNVPETQIGIIAASTATRRQRIQRLGRILRPSSGKEGAVIYTLVATEPEIARLRQEEQDLEGVAQTTWSRM